MLAHLAADPSRDRGRLHPEPEPRGRNGFQRDRDRIIHSTAFRKLIYKTQVFVNHEGDRFRTRLTHTLEVSQIARSVARRLRLHEDLTEAICLAHDLGHTPFGHAGQHALNAIMRQQNAASEGFEHNLQSLRVVDSLERRYAAFDGLNLCFETRSGILKHCPRRAAEGLGPVGERFLTGQSPCLEAQLANLADEVAYNHHDLDDGLSSGLLSREEVFAIPLVARAEQEVRRRYPQIAEDRLVPEMIRWMINEQVDDLERQTQLRVQDLGLQTLDEVRSAPVVVGFSAEMAAQVQGMKRFLFRAMYRHPRVVEMTEAAQQTVEDLFLSEQQRLGDERVAADSVAAMTDREAMALHARRFPGRIHWPESVWAQQA